MYKIGFVYHYYCSYGSHILFAVIDCYDKHGADCPCKDGYDGTTCDEGELLPSFNLTNVIGYLKGNFLQQ